MFFFFKTSNNLPLNLEVSYEFFRGAGEVEFQLLNENELKSMGTYKELMPKEEVLG